jgi:hypothetical protein
MPKTSREIITKKMRKAVETKEILTTEKSRETSMKTAFSPLTMKIYPNNRSGELRSPKVAE